MPLKSWMWAGMWMGLALVGREVAAQPQELSLEPKTDAASSTVAPASLDPTDDLFALCRGGFVPRDVRELDKLEAPQRREWLIQHCSAPLALAGYCLAGLPKESAAGFFELEEPQRQPFLLTQCKGEALKRAAMDERARASVRRALDLEYEVCGKQWGSAAGAHYEALDDKAAGRWLLERCGPRTRWYLACEPRLSDADKKAYGELPTYKRNAWLSEHCAKESPDPLALVSRTSGLMPGRTVVVRSEPGVSGIEEATLVFHAQLLASTLEVGMKDKVTWTMEVAPAGDESCDALCRLLLTQRHRAAAVLTIRYSRVGDGIGAQLSVHDPRQPKAVAVSGGTAEHEASLAAALGGTIPALRGPLTRLLDDDAASAHRDTASISGEPAIQTPGVVPKDYVHQDMVKVGVYRALGTVFTILGVVALFAGGISSAQASSASEDGGASIGTLIGGGVLLGVGAGLHAGAASTFAEVKRQESQSANPKEARASGLGVVVRF